MSHEPFRLNQPGSMSAALRGLVEPSTVLQNGFGRSFEYLLGPDVGRGRVEYVDAAPEMWIVAVDCVFRRDLRFKVLDAGLVRFNFGLSLDVTMQLEGLGRVIAKEPSWRVLHNPPQAITIENYPKDTPTRWVTIACRPQLIAQLAGVDESELPALFQSTDSAGSHRDSTSHQPHAFCARMRTATADVLTARISGPARVSYIRARCTELLCLAVMRLTQVDYATSTRARLTERDREMLMRIKAQIDTAYLNCPSCAELSRQYGINRNKLFYGFKDLFGVSVSDYVRDLKIVEGRRLLIETDLPITAISEKLGFAHPGNFSTAIKRLYGVTPLALRARR